MDLRPVTEDDLDEAGTVFVESLGADPGDGVGERMGRYWELDRTNVVVDGRGRIMGVAAGAASRITLAGGRAVAGGAVPHVGVRPTAQGLGVGRRLLEAQVRAAAAAGEGFLALNASEMAIYGRYGYGPTSAWWDVALDPRRVTWAPGAPPPGQVEEVEGDEALAALQELYGRAYGRWPGEVDRWDGWWQVRLERRPWHKSRLHVLLHHGDEGEVDAAALHTTEDSFDATGFANKLAVVDLFGIDERAQGRLVRWMAGQRLLGEVRCSRIDPGTALPWMLGDARQLVTKELGDAVWVRVLDPATVLGARTTCGEGRVVLELEDPLLPEVAGTWALTGETGRLTCERTDAAPDVTLPIDLLAPLAWTYVTATVLARSGRLVAHEPSAVPVLDRLLAWHRPSWCTTGF